MAKEKTVLVLGAGASRGYGFPVGAGLRQEILKLGGDSHASDLMQVGRQELASFTKAFKESQSYSIDAFLGRRVEFSDVGKKAIALVLLRCEAMATLLDE